MSLHLLNKSKSTNQLIDESINSIKNIPHDKMELWILTCYIDLEFLSNYINSIIKNNNFSAIYLQFDKNEIAKSGVDKILNETKSIKKILAAINIEFDWRVLTCDRYLMHCKSYAVIKRNKGKITGGFTITTSANFTKSGILGLNTEVGYISFLIKDLMSYEDIYNDLWDNNSVPIEKLREIEEKQSHHRLMYEILNSGVFIHKWSGNLKQVIGIKYELTESAKEKTIIAPELTAVGFETGDTFSRQILPLRSLPKKEIPRSFITRFTIETYWGRWCPRDAWNCLSLSFFGSDLFIKKFKQLTESKKLDAAIARAHKVQINLVEKELVLQPPNDHFENWRNKINDLRANHNKLYRLHTGYEANELPYEYTQIKEIADLFNSIKEMLDSSITLNVAKKKFLSALNHKNPGRIRLTQNEIKEIQSHKL